MGIRRTIPGLSRSIADKLVLYGCGDIVDDYEGIGGYEEYRDELRLLYFASVEPGSADGLTRLRMVPMRARRIRLDHASEEESEWLHATLQNASRLFGTRIDREAGGELTVSSGQIRSHRR